MKKKIDNRRLGLGCTTFSRYFDVYYPIISGQFTTKVLNQGSEKTSLVSYQNKDQYRVYVFHAIPEAREDL